MCVSVIPIRSSRASRSTPGGSFDDLHSFGVWREIELLLLYFRVELGSVCKKKYGVGLG